jgi:hypothetical protein
MPAKSTTFNDPPDEGRGADKVTDAVSQLSLPISAGPTDPTAFLALVHGAVVLTATDELEARQSMF